MGQARVLFGRYEAVAALRALARRPGWLCAGTSASASCSATTATCAARSRSASTCRCGNGAFRREKGQSRERAGTNTGTTSFRWRSPAPRTARSPTPTSQIRTGHRPARGRAVDRVQPAAGGSRDARRHGVRSPPRPRSARPRPPVAARHKTTYRACVATRTLPTRDRLPDPATKALNVHVTRSPHRCRHEGSRLGPQSSGPNR